ncbi:helix-turn-helix domain-containing protein [Streptomyces sp. NBC_01808]|uniref:helix-turn-helix domain-containing protein n=1 Tax=Streptomyces sp. NBC_01808 TaxID=2975947 RepID=UPI002DDB2A85|nr:helix-turn-helix domain-containing protein [Streptomyces sp. NBC_01808]WSA40376.1 helix-turn-helix domain-containing protein [Streptomyces sp. NBC_01808]
MLRIHFRDADLVRTRVADAPDPLWEIAVSLHRLQTRRGRYAHAAWYRMARRTLRERGLERAVRETLLPLYPRARYFPDFLTPGQVPGEAVTSFRDGAELLLAAPPGRVRGEVGRLARTVGAPAWAPKLAETGERREFVRLLRAYYEAVVEPWSDHMQARLEAERAARIRGLLDGGSEGMLAGLAPAMHWRAPVLEVRYPAGVDRDLRLDGRGLTLVPSYFAADAPVSLADPELPPVLWYPVHHRQAPVPPGPGHPPEQRLAALLGRARAAVLHATAHGATTGELARATGVSASAASRHAGALRDAGLITTVRDGGSVLHTLTPAGAAVLRASVAAATSGAAATSVAAAAARRAADRTADRSTVRAQARRPAAVQIRCGCGRSRSDQPG